MTEDREQLRKQIRQLQDELDECHEHTKEMVRAVTDTLCLVAEGDYDARCSAPSDDATFATLGQAANVVIEAVGATIDELLRRRKEAEQTHARLQQQFALVRKQQHAIEEMSVPIIELYDHLLALPIIGVVDDRRTSLIMAELLDQIREKQARMVLVDLTGVSTVDTYTASHLVKIVASARLLGAQCILSGVSPAVATTVVELGASFGDIPTARNLHRGLEMALAKLGLGVQPLEG